MLRARSGAVLVFTLLLLVVMDCILVGLLEVARQQRRVAENRAVLVSLQLAAEGAIRRSLAEWPASLDSIGRTDDPEHAIRIRTRFEPLTHDLALIHATASASAGARYTASLLATPPAIPRDTAIHGAALVAQTATLYSGSVVSAGPPTACDRRNSVSTSTVSPAVWLPGARIEGPVSATDSALPAWLNALADAPHVSPRVRIASGDTVISGAFDGVLVGTGAVTLAGTAVFRGLLIARGDLTVASGASLEGTARTGAHAHVHGNVTHDACVVDAVIRQARLRVATPAPGRAWVPGF